MTDTQGKTVWAVIPIQRLSEAKTRLSPLLPPRIRRRLVLTMLSDVLDALAGVRDIGGIIVVSPNQDVLSFVASKGAIGLVEKGRAGMNGAICAGRDAAVARGAGSLLILPGDIPRVTSAEIVAMIARADGQDGIVVVPSQNGGTNALLIAPPDALQPCFGVGSSRHHIDQAMEDGLGIVVHHANGIGFDVDLPDHVRALGDHPETAERYKFLTPYIVPHPTEQMLDYSPKGGRT